MTALEALGASLVTLAWTIAIAAIVVILFRPPPGGPPPTSPSPR